MLLCHKKEWKFSIFDNMDGGHYTQWSKSDRERQVVSVFTYMWNLKIK